MNYGGHVGNDSFLSLAANSFDKFGFDIFYKLEIISEGKPVLVGKAKTGMICYDYQNKKVISVPGKLKDSPV